MFISCKQKNKPLHRIVVVYSVFVLSVLFISCGNSSGKEAELPKVQHVDTLKIKAQNISRIYVSKITAANGNDSVLLILDRIGSLLYKVDKVNHIIGVDTLPRTVTEDLKAFTYHKGAYYVLYENLLKRFPVNGFNEKPKEYTFNHSDVNIYYSTISQFKIDSNQGFLICGAPKGINFSEGVGRERFFGSEIVNRAIINEESAHIKTKPVSGVTFPERYKKFYYNDTYPIFNSFGDSVVYTTRYFDSLAIVSGDKKVFFKLPKQFSVFAEPAPEESVQSKTKSDEYFATHSYNTQIIKYKNKILLFQGIKVDKYYDDESGMLSDPISLRKRVLIFDIDKKQFEQTAYELPTNCNPIKSIIFSGKLYLFSNDETRRVISILPVTL